MIRVFPKRTKWTPTDNLTFVGYPPPLFLPEDQPVMISVVFTWDIPEAERLLQAWKCFYKNVYIGGPAFDDPGGEFEPGRFIKSGVTITSRGCIRTCPHCFVPAREGNIRELPIRDGWIVQDNNLLACTRAHIEAVFDMLRRQKKAAVLSGGLDIRLLQPWHRELLDSIRINELWVACDSAAMIPMLERAATALDGIPQRKKRCYAMIGYNGEKISEAEKRLETIYKFGFDPFCQLYRGEKQQDYSQDWKNLNYKWSRPAAYHSAAKAVQNITLIEQ